MIRAIFFDAVGTVLFPTPSASSLYVQVAAKHGLKLEEADVRARLWTQYRTEEALDRAGDWATSEAREVARWQNIVQQAIPHATPELFTELYRHYATPDAWALAPDTAEVLVELAHRGYILGLASNYDRRFLSVVAGHSGLAPLADRVVVSSIVGTRKPGPAFFRAVLASSGCDPEQILFIGDDIENDIHGASAAGFRTVLIDPQAKHAHITPRVQYLRELLPALSR